VTALVLAVASVALVAWSAAFLRRVGAGRSLRRAASALPAAVSDLARSVRAGATLELALRELAPTTEGVLETELAGAVALLDRGHEIDRVLRVWGRASHIDGVALLVAACRFSLDRSVALERALDGVAAALLDRVEVDDEVRALASQARTSAVVLVALPPVGAVLFGVLDPDFASVLLSTAAGRSCLVGGLALDATGAWASRRLVQRAVHGRRPRQRPGIGTPSAVGTRSAA
jgi:tight adherence protein B